MKIGFIGIGNMGGSILKGFIKKGIDCKNIYIFDINLEKSQQLKNEHNIVLCNSYKELIENVDVLILAVKPDILLKLLKDIYVEIVTYKPIIVSIAAGISINNILNSIKNENIKIVRIMPNINASINLSTSAYCYQNINEEDLEKVKNLFNNIGSLFYIPEEKFNIFTAIAGCSPAYIFLFLDSLAKGALKMGLNKNEALNIAIDVLIGSAKMLKESKKNPWELIDSVCSPGGTTIEGICALEENNFQQSIVKAIEKTISKDLLLNKNLEERLYERE